jgi:hypothetical protein
MGLTFQLFHTFYIKLFTNKYYILINLPEVKKKVDKMPKDYIFSTFFFLGCFSTIKLRSCETHIWS